MENEKELSIKEIQNILLDIYKSVDEICKKHDWKLFLAGGSTLGAVRHHGFIPWDDDLDLTLPREDYEGFAKIAKEELPDYLKLTWIQRLNHYRIEDLRYEMKLNDAYQRSINEGEKTYVFADLQPFDGVPKSIIIRIFHCIRVMFYRMAYRMCSSEKICIESWRRKWELYLIALLKKMPFLFRKEEKLQRKFDKSMKKYNYVTCEYIADFVGKYLFRDIYPKRWWEPGMIVTFEGIPVRIPSEYDKYLSRIYGDYMRIPDEKEQITHRELSNRSN
ncbi:MAG: LicD family protein [Clostridium sp.]|nr:LicD family protein [Clostridium sp.]